MKTVSITFALVLALFQIGCDKKKTEATAVGGEAPAAATNGATNGDAEKVRAAAAEEKPEPAESSRGDDYDPSKLPEAVDVKDPLETGLAWQDSSGENLLVFARETETEGDETTIRLTASHWQKPEGEDWAKVKTHEETLANCSPDGDVTPYVGDWSVTDIDSDGLSEATFAWSVGCRSDMSPIDHKVLMSEGSEGWILEGKTAVTIPGEEPVAGELTDASAFEGASKEMRAHADRVWYETSNEMRARKYE